MRDRAELDPGSLALLAHLEAYVNRECNPDPAVVRKYIDYVKADHRVVTGSSDVLESPVLTSFVPLLSRILFSDLYRDLYAELLTAMLDRLSFAETLKFFSPEFIVQALALPAYAVVHLALRTLLTWLQHNDEDARVYLSDGEALALLLRRVLTAPDMPVSVVSNTDEILTLLSSTRSFTVPVQLLKDVHASVTDVTVILRYCHVVGDAAPFLDPPTLADLAHFDMLLRLGNEDADLETLALVDFYTRMVTLGYLDSVKEPVYQTLKYFSLCRETGEQDFLVDMGLRLLLALVSHSGSTWVPELLEEFPALAMFDFSEGSEILMFCRFNISAIEDKPLFFETFRNWEFDMVPYMKFRCMLHLIEDAEFFKLLITNRKLSKEELTKLPQDLVYELLEMVARFDYSTTYLLHELPSIVLDYLVDSDSLRVNSKIWDSKTNALQALLQGDVDLGVWKEGLLKRYSEMMNTNVFPPPEPRVDVMDMAM